MRTEMRKRLQFSSGGFRDFHSRIASMREMRKAYRILVGRPEEKRSLVRSGHTCDDNIKLDLKK